MLIIIMPNVLVLGVVLPSVTMLNVAAPLKAATNDGEKEMNFNLLKVHFKWPDSLNRVTG